MTEDEELEKTLLEKYRYYVVSAKKGTNQKIYHLIDFEFSVGTRCGYPLNEQFRYYNYEPPVGLLMCEDCKNGNLDWSRRI